MMTDKMFLDICDLIGKNSHSQRNQVGCIIVLNGRIISSGYNGTLEGRNNRCENENFETLPEVIHGEENAILFALRNSSINLSEAVLYTSLSPCFNCAKLIRLSGIKTVVYKTAYRDTAPVEWLNEVGVRCIQIS